MPRKAKSTRIQPRLISMQSGGVCTNNHSLVNMILRKYRRQRATSGLRRLSHSRPIWRVGMATVLDCYDEPEKTLPAAANDSDGGYRPTNDEPFMGPRQLDYFREKLLA